MYKQPNTTAAGRRLECPDGCRPRIAEMERTEQGRGQHKRRHRPERELEPSKHDAPDEQLLVEGHKEEAAKAPEQERPRIKADRMDVVPTSQRIDANGQRDYNAPKGEFNPQVTNRVMRIEGD